MERQALKALPAPADSPARQDRRVQRVPEVRKASLGHAVRKESRDSKGYAGCRDFKASKVCQENKVHKG